MLNRLLPASVLLLLLTDIVLIATCYLLATFAVLEVDPSVWIVYGQGWLRIAIVVVALVFGLYLQDLYSQLRISSRFLLIQQACMALGLAFLLQALLGYLAPQLGLPRWVMVTGSLLLLIVFPLWRLFMGTTGLAAMAADRVLFLGGSPINRDVARRYEERPELGRTTIGFVVDPQEADSIPSQWILGDLNCFRTTVREKSPSRIVVGFTERRQRMPVEDLLEINFSGVVVEDSSAAFEHAFGRVSTSQLRPSQLIFSRELGPRPSTLKLQNAYSFLIAAVGLAILAPIMIVVAILVKLTSPGPALYRQRRVGFQNRPFTVFKFRSMRQDAEAKSGAVWASKDDPRITAFGKFIRKTRLDELPQLFNVLRGEMSIVGPRPERPEFVEVLSEKIPFYRQRHCVKPGITGWAQINHKYGDTVEDTITKLEYDLYYIKNLNFTLDFLIMLQTAKVMLLSRGSQ